jgi:hypothetical protein
MAAVLVIGPIFEVDLLPQQHGFRPGLDAKMALRRVYWHVTQRGRREVVDADLLGYFNSIPHAPLMRSLSRRIADGRLLHVIKRWLTAPVVEVIDGRSVQTAEARRTRNWPSCRSKLTKKRVGSWTSAEARASAFWGSTSAECVVCGAYGAPTTRPSSKKRTALLRKLKDVFRRHQSQLVDRVEVDQPGAARLGERWDTPVSASAS